jgi:mRNA interferase MazF
MVELKRFEVWLINLDPTVGSEIKKTRPCVIIAPNEMNSLNTTIIAPLTSKGFDFPMRLHVKFEGKNGLILCDQIRTVDKRRLIKKLGVLKTSTCKSLCELLQEMFVY